MRSLSSSTMRLARFCMFCWVIGRVLVVAIRSTSSMGVPSMKGACTSLALGSTLTTVVEPRWMMVVSAPLACRSWATSCPLLPVPSTSAFLPRHLAPVLNPSTCITSPLKSFRPGRSGMLGAPITPLARMMCFGRSVRSVPSERRTCAFHVPLASS